MDRQECTGIVLAAGAGTRYGKPKVLAEAGAWLRGAVRALREGGCAQVWVVLGATGPARRDPEGHWLVCESPRLVLPDGARPVWAPDWAVGVSASMRAGLIAVAKSAVEPGNPAYAAILTVDTPDIGADVVARVVAAAHAAPSGLARATFHGRPGHPVVLSHRHWDEVIRSAQRNSGARAFLGKRPDTVAVTCDDLATGRDHDYPSSRSG